MALAPYTPHHADWLVDIFHRAVHDSASGYTALQREAWAPTPPDREKWRARLAETRPWVALRHDQPVGFIEVDTLGRIDCCYVAPEAQRQGIARHMVLWVESWARQAGIPALHVDVSRTAQALFEGLGFRVVRRCHPVRRSQVLPNVAMQKRLS